MNSNFLQSQQPAVEDSTRRILFYIPKTFQNRKDNNRYMMDSLKSFAEKANSFITTVMIKFKENEYTEKDKNAVLDDIEYISNAASLGFCYIDWSIYDDIFSKSNKTFANIKNTLRETAKTIRTNPYQSEFISEGTIDSIIKRHAKEREKNVVVDLSKSNQTFTR